MSDLISRQAVLDMLWKLHQNRSLDSDRWVLAQCVREIDALPSSQPEACDDAISREDAKWVVFCNRDHVEDQANAIDSLPCVQPSTQQWIPCSERLPAYGEDVLLSIGKYCNVGYLVAANDETDGEWYYSGWYHPMNDVSAWMPLPDPYKEENNG